MGFRPGFEADLHSTAVWRLARVGKLRAAHVPPSEHRRAGSPAFDHAGPCMRQPPLALATWLAEKAKRSHWPEHSARVICFTPLWTPLCSLMRLVGRDNSFGRHRDPRGVLRRPCHAGASLCNALSPPTAAPKLHRNLPCIRLFILSEVPLLRPFPSAKLEYLGTKQPWPPPTPPCSPSVAKQPLDTDPRITSEHSWVAPHTRCVRQGSRPGPESTIHILRLSAHSMMK